MPLDHIGEFDPELARAEAERLAFLRQVERSNRQLQRITAVVFWLTFAVLLPPGLILAVIIGLSRRAVRLLRRG